MRWLLLILLIPFAQAVELSGNVYDDTLLPLNDVILTIDTEPKQQYISKNGGYKFTLSPGTYILTAKYHENGRLEYYSEEKLKIADDGVFVFDLILFPYLGEEEALSEDFELDVSSVEYRTRPLYHIFAVLAFLVFSGIIWLILRRKRIPDDDAYAMVLALIKRNKRITQKEIRKQVPMSEAKVSLIITELRDKGVVKKIKKGRGNVIVLK